MRDAGDGSLTRLQTFVAESVRASVTSGADPKVVFEADRLLVAGTRRLAPAERLEIYREQYWLRHLSNLVDDFPTLGFVLGDAGFRELARAYLQAHPPRTWNLQRLGADLPAYLAREARWSHDRLAVDACRLDWAFMEAFDAPDAGPLDLNALATASEEAVASATLTLHPSLRRLVLDHPAHELREAVKRAAVTERPAALLSRVVVWREITFALKAVVVEAMGFDLLNELASGTPLGRACETVARVHGAVEDDLGARVGGWFQQWTGAGWVSAVHLAPSPPFKEPSERSRDADGS